MEYLCFGILLFTTAVPCFSYPSGPPTSSSVCDSMIPQHGFSQQGSPSPYDITVSNTCYKSGDTITVEIVPTDGNPFKGYFVQARNGSSTVGLVQHGKFQTAEDSSQQQTLTCFNFQNFAVSHKTRDLKQKAMFKWTPNPGKQADIIFTATIVKNTATFWVGATSQKVRFDPACRLPIETTTAPNKVIPGGTFMADSITTAKLMTQSSSSTKTTTQFTGTPIRPISSANLGTMPNVFLMVLVVVCIFVN